MSCLFREKKNDVETRYRSLQSGWNVANIVFCDFVVCPERKTKQILRTTLVYIQSVLDCSVDFECIFFGCASITLDS